MRKAPNHFQFAAALFESIFCSNLLKKIGKDEMLQENAQRGLLWAEMLHEHGKFIHSEGAFSVLVDSFSGSRNLEYLSIYPPGHQS